MTDRTPPPKRESLGDTAYLAWALVDAFRVFIAHVAKRWPDIRGVR
jgi:hypothetical protein